MVQIASSNINLFGITICTGKHHRNVLVYMYTCRLMYNWWRYHTDIIYNESSKTINNQTQQLGTPKTERWSPKIHHIELDVRIHVNIAAVVVDATTVWRRWVGMETSLLALLYNRHAPRRSQSKYPMSPDMDEKGTTWTCLFKFQATRIYCTPGKKIVSVYVKFGTVQWNYADQLSAICRFIECP